jgi:hypothetical protein
MNSILELNIFMGNQCHIKARALRAAARVELLPTFKFTGKTVKISEFTDNYR